MSALAIVVAGALGCHNDADALYRSQRAGGQHADASVDAATDASQSADPYEAALRIFGTGRCAQCAARKCEADARSCAADVDCSAEALCRAQCNEPACGLRCSDRYPFDARPTQAIQQCIAEHCVEECQPGEDFGCAGDYVRPAPARDAIILWSFELIRWNTEDPLPAGIGARLCRTVDLDCEKPISEASSNAKGIVKLEVPVEFPFGRPTPFNGYVEFFDPTQPPRIVTTIAFWGGSGAAEAPVASNHTPWRYPLQTPEDQAAGAAFLGVAPSATDHFAALAGSIYDCRGSDTARGAGVMIRANTATASTHVYYGASLGVSKTFLDGGFLIGPLPLGAATLTATHDGDTVAVLEIVMRKKTNTGVFLFPTAR